MSQGKQLKTEIEKGSIHFFLLAVNKGGREVQVQSFHVAHDFRLVFFLSSPLSRLFLAPRVSIVIVQRSIRMRL